MTKPIVSLPESQKYYFYKNYELIELKTYKNEYI